MPTYQDLYCEGACERLGHKCLRPELFVRLASEYGAVPKEITGETAYQDDSGEIKSATWKFYALDVQGEKREKAIQATVAMLHKQFKEDASLENLAISVEKTFLQEFPCHLECDITICGYCGNQHEEKHIFEGGCELLAEEWGKGYE